MRYRVMTRFWLLHRYSKDWLLNQRAEHTTEAPGLEWHDDFRTKPGEVISRTSFRINHVNSLQSCEGWRGTPVSVPSLARYTLPLVAPGIPSMPLGHTFCSHSKHCTRTEHARPGR